MLFQPTPLRIMVMEDGASPDAQLITRLEHLGYQPLGPATDAATALALCRSGPWPDLLLFDLSTDVGVLDVVLALALQLQEFHARPLILLADADGPTFAQAHRIRPHAYLVKPVTDVALHRAIELAAGCFASRQPAIADGDALEPPAIFDPASGGRLLTDTFFVKNDNVLVKVAVADILWIEADDKHCRLVLATHTVLVRQSLRELGRRLPPAQFVQVQRRYLVNVRFIERIDLVRNVVLVGVQILPLSLTYRHELLRRVQQV